jgi:hypothetical protein
MVNGTGVNLHLRGIVFLRNLQVNLGAKIAKLVLVIIGLPAGKKETRLGSAFAKAGRSVSDRLFLSGARRGLQYNIFKV